MLAPTLIAASTVSSLPSIFAACPPGHMFEQGAYSVLDKLGAFVYKGAVFYTMGFVADLLETAISNVLIGMTKKMSPTSEVWFSNNLCYQVVNGLEFAMANALSRPLFKASILCTRSLNNVVGGMSLVALTRLTGSQKAEAPKQLEMSAFQTNKASTAHSGKASTNMERLKEESLNLLKE
ncbi:hypothetical protein L7F22_055176 [Adiantum nelumboides]|nr:hypothetical protein [Adiantum nelumboides]